MDRWIGWRGRGPVDRRVIISSILNCRILDSISRESLYNYQPRRSTVAGFPQSRGQRCQTSAKKVQLVLLSVLPHLEFDMDQPAASSVATPTAIVPDSAPGESTSAVAVARDSTSLLPNAVPIPNSQPSSISLAVSQLDIASGSSLAALVAPTTEPAPTFKAPFPPAPTAHGYLPDIEAIMAGGHDAPEVIDEAAGGGSNLAEVVRDLKARAGFKVKEEEGVVPAGDELDTINAEMGALGAVDVRPRAVKEEEGDVVMEGQGKSGLEVAEYVLSSVDHSECWSDDVC